MRDPAGYIEFVGDAVIRHVFPGHIENLDFLRSKLAESLVDTGKLIPFELQETSVTKIYSQRITFQSLPIDWCASQLKAAAELTLEISTLISEKKYELKDASAWNVLFIGCEPIFCDHLSFRKITGNNWWAFGQYIRNFIFPLAISKYQGLQVSHIFRIFKDGAAVDFTKKILGVRVYITRYWPLLIQFKKGRVVKNVTKNKESTNIHNNLYEYLKFILSGVKNQKKMQEWTNYTEDRCHYHEDAIVHKKKIVTDWLTETKPKRVIDLGCNTGEFSYIALSMNAEVVAVDGSEGCIELLFSQNRGNKNLYPVLANLGDVCGGGGWCGKEYESIISRLENWGDALLMLAVIHHLAISESIPYEAISAMAAKICRKYLIIELISHDDDMVQSLCLSRNRSPRDFTLDKQVAAFSQSFEFIRQIELPGGMRSIALLNKKNE